MSLKTTTLLSVQGQEIIIPNSTILSTEILNYGKMTHRRQRISLGIQYSTPSEKLEKIPNLIKSTISEVETTKFERCYLEKITENGFTFLASYDILDPDYEKSLQINQQIYFALVRKFESEKIAFSLPSHLVYSSDSDSQHDK
ncbi:mechanosensitive ion channel family protein [bacterium]|nr:mechanosensitive ion channel family protein [bacterium]